LWNTYHRSESWRDLLIGLASCAVFGGRETYLLVDPALTSCIVDLASTLDLGSGCTRLGLDWILPRTPIRALRDHPRKP
jgi:hypothetical protein